MKFIVSIATTAVMERDELFDILHTLAAVIITYPEKKDGMIFDRDYSHVGHWVVEKGTYANER